MLDFANMVPEVRYLKEGEGDDFRFLRKILIIH